MCHRFPRLKFVSEESGVGWVPFLLEAMDWQWLNSGCREEHPETDLPASLSRGGTCCPRRGSADKPASAGTGEQKRHRPANASPWLSFVAEGFAGAEV